MMVGIDEEQKEGTFPKGKLKQSEMTVLTEIEGTIATEGAHH